MRRESRKRAVQNRVRKTVLRDLFDADPICRRCCAAYAEDGHEVLSRARGGSITDPGNIVLLCRRCHDWITNEPHAAEVEGWSISQFGGAA